MAETEIVPPPETPLAEIPQPTLPSLPDAGTEERPGPEEKLPEEPGEEKPGPPWASIEKAEDLFEHETLKPLLEERDNESLKRGRREAQSRLQPFLQTLERQYEQIANQASEVAEAWRELVEGAPDTKEVREFFRKYEPQIEGMAGAHYSQGYLEAATGFVAALAARAGVEKEDLADFDLDLRHDLRSVLSGQKKLDGTILDRVVKAMTSGAVKDALAKEKSRLEKLAVEEADAKVKAKERENSGAPVKAQAGGGGGGGLTATIIENMSDEERERRDPEIRAWFKANLTGG